MKLLPKEIRKEMPTYEEIACDDDPMVMVKFFHPLSDWTWYACSFDPDEGIFWGLVDGFEREMGSFSLKEMRGVRVLGLGIERDTVFRRMPLSTIGQRLESGRHV